MSEHEDLWVDLKTMDRSAPAHNGPGDGQRVRLRFLGDGCYLVPPGRNQNETVDLGALIRWVVGEGRAELEKRGIAFDTLIEKRLRIEHKEICVALTGMSDPLQDPVQVAKRLQAENASTTDRIAKVEREAAHEVARVRQEFHDFRGEVASALRATTACAPEIASILQAIVQMQQRVTRAEANAQAAATATKQRDQARVIAESSTADVIRMHADLASALDVGEDTKWPTMVKVARGFRDELARRDADEPSESDRPPCPTCEEAGREDHGDQSCDDCDRCDDCHDQFGCADADDASGAPLTLTIVAAVAGRLRAAQSRLASAPLQTSEAAQRQRDHCLAHQVGALEQVCRTEAAVVGDLATLLETASR